MTHLADRRYSVDNQQGCPMCGRNLYTIQEGLNTHLPECPTLEKQAITPRDAPVILAIEPGSIECPECEGFGCAACHFDGEVPRQLTLTLPELWPAGHPFHPAAGEGTDPCALCGMAPGP